MPWWAVLLIVGGISFVGLLLWTIIKNSVEDAREEKAAEILEAMEEAERFSDIDE